MTTKKTYSYTTFLENAKQIQNTVQLNAELELLQKSTKSYLKRFENGDEDGIEGFEDMPLYSYFGVNPRKYTETSVVPLREFDAIIQNMMAGLSHDTFEKIWSIFLPDMYHNFQIILNTVKEIIARKDEELQILFVQQFLRAMKHYDGGHRYWEKTVQDQLIDTYFGKFEAEPLYLLLEKADDDCLTGNGGDGMDTLFAPAFKKMKKASPEIQKKMERLFSSYIQYIKRYFEPSYVINILDWALPYTHAPYRAKLQKERDALTRLNILLTQVREYDPKVTKTIIRELGKTIHYNEYAELKSDIFRSLAKDFYDLDTLGYLLQFSIKNDLHNGISSFRDTAVITSIFRSDTRKALEIIQHLTPENSSIIPKGYWDSSVSIIGKQLLERMDFDFETPEYTDVMLFFTWISKKTPWEFETEIITDCIISLIASIKKIPSAQYQLFVNFISKNSARLHHLGAFWDALDDVFQYEILYENISYFQLSEEEMNLFYKNYFEACMNARNWKSFDTLLSHLEKDETGKYILNFWLSDVFVTYIAETISYDDENATESYKRIEKIKLQPLDFQRILAQLLGWSINRRKWSMIEKIVSLIPETIEWDILAYNLCCYYAKKKDIEHLLIAVSRAIELGKTEDQFLDDPDFDTYKTNPTFLQAIKTKK